MLIFLGYLIDNVTLSQLTPLGTPVLNVVFERKTDFPADQIVFINRHAIILVK